MPLILKLIQFSICHLLVKEKKGWGDVSTWVLFARLMWGALESCDWCLNSLQCWRVCKTGFVFFFFPSKTLANHSLFKFLLWVFCGFFFLLMPHSTGMKGTENLPSVYIEWSFQMQCLSVFFRVTEYMLWLVQMYNTKLSFLLREHSYFIADAYYFYFFLSQRETLFTMVDFSLSFFSFILHLSFV